MINEWEEFCAYTGTVSYTASKKSDTAWLGRFTFATILKFEGRVTVAIPLCSRHSVALLTSVKNCLLFFIFSAPVVTFKFFTERGFCVLFGDFLFYLIRNHIQNIVERHFTAL